jgi:hypothetical protein
VLSATSTVFSADSILLRRFDRENYRRCWSILSLVVVSSCCSETPFEWTLIRCGRRRRAKSYLLWCPFLDRGSCRRCSSILSLVVVSYCCSYRVIRPTLEWSEGWPHSRTAPSARPKEAISTLEWPDGWSHSERACSRVPSQSRDSRQWEK